MTWDEYFDSAAQGLRPTSDFEWYAIDRKGQVAFLTSAGFGAIPMRVFRDRQAYHEAADFFRRLPTGRGHVLFVKGPYEWSSWIAAAEQGLYGYDWDAAAGQYLVGYPYRRLTAPQRPLTVSELPARTREWIAPIWFDSDFDTAPELFPEWQFAEVNL